MVWVGNEWDCNENGTVIWSILILILKDIVYTGSVWTCKNISEEKVTKERMKYVQSFVKGQTISANMWEHATQEFWLCVWKGKFVYEDVLCLLWRMPVLDGQNLLCICN